METCKGESTNVSVIDILLLQATSNALQSILAKDADPLFDSLVSNLKLIGHMLENQVGTTPQDQREIMQEDLAEPSTGMRTPPPTLPAPDAMVRTTE